MKCPACSCDIPDEDLELCPHCGSPLFRGAEESDALTNSGDETDLRLKELIEDVKRGLEELPGEASSQEPPLLSDTLSPAFDQVVSNSSPEATQKESEHRKEELLAFDLKKNTSGQTSKPETSESVSQENSTSAPDGVVPQEHEKQSLPKRKAGLLAIAAACAAIAVLIFVSVNFRHILFTPPAPSEKPHAKDSISYEALPEEQVKKEQEPPPPVPARQVVPADNLTQQEQGMPEDQQYAASHPQADNTTTPSLEQDLSQQSAPQPQEPQQFFTLHTDSYRSKHKAEREAQRLRNLGHDAFVQVFDSSGSGRWYRVMIGKFSTREDATRALEDVRQRLQKKDCRVVRLP